MKSSLLNRDVIRQYASEGYMTKQRRILLWFKNKKQDGRRFRNQWHVSGWTSSFYQSSGDLHTYVSNAEALQRHGQGHSPSCSLCHG